MSAKFFVIVTLVVLFTAAVPRTAAAAEPGACPAPPAESEAMHSIVDRFASRQILQFGRGPGVTDEWLAAPISRVEFAVLLARASGWVNAAPAAQPPFPDLAGHWASGYVSVLARQSIVIGHADGTFTPDATLTAAHMDLLLGRAAEQLRIGELEPASPCPDPDSVTHGQALIALDRFLGLVDAKEQSSQRLRAAMDKAARRMIALRLIVIRDNW